MPEQAFALKKYRCGRSPVSKISDNEDATAPLWNSEMLSVKNSVGEPIPAVGQPSEEGSKSPSFVNGQHAGHVLPKKPAGAKAASKFNEFEREVTTASSQARSESCDTEVLAGGSSDKSIWSRGNSFDFREVAIVGNVQVVMLQ